MPIPNRRTRNRGQDILNRVLAQSKAADQATRAFDALPAMRRVAARYCWYISPYVTYKDRLLLERAVPAAVTILGKHCEGDAHAAVRGFIDVLMRHACGLGEIRISVLSAEGDWLIWDYASPLMEMLRLHRRDSVMIRKRPAAVQSGAIAVKLLSYMCTSADLEVAGIVIGTGGGALT